MATTEAQPTKTAEEAAAAQARSDARAARIAAAVERSKTEYQPQHAYTERGAEQAGPSKKDRQRVEYAATWRLLSPSSSPAEAQRALDDILSCLPLLKGSSEDADPATSRDLSKLTGMPRELLGTALRAASEAGKSELAAEIARSLKRHWKANPGLALASSDALVEVSATESLRPLFVITAVAIHYPILLALGERLDLALKSGEGQAEDAVSSLEAVSKVAHSLARNRAWGFQTDLFADEKGEKVKTKRPPPMAGGELRDALLAADRRKLEKVIGVDGSTLDQALKRLGKALGKNEDEVVIPDGERNERGVRDL
ncbi:hypothetical protein A1Q1_00163 [Trichosporon asahii var. asahii CBS 2479]|uniref:Uncharacterized protein n=1 Tax=Trichosporon asahii var. asahii (strain ATCC 90039 / CBS 2479 / JCM 2466 / KCTC 7840 / NBRC 103889/ NCYC 2677 / UAMH 7654) TaxID=1186058 RepID=J6F5J0_TRIAS|nr:hypothetical protein A1Q1_00163 [Trichosporon asahii var. asahii CBS 2479]EJT50542.1 hypothetical protein A1Q1_00163 [Trichosporon asahii var. asahii CBS 2479]